MKYVLYIGIVAWVLFFVMILLFPVSWTTDLNELTQREIIILGITNGLLGIGIIQTYFTFKFRDKIFKKYTLV